MTRIPPMTDAALPVEYNYMYDVLACSALIVFIHTPSLLFRLLLRFSTGKELVSQATPFAERKESGHTATTELSPRNAIIGLI